MEVMHDSEGPTTFEERALKAENNFYKSLR